MAHHGSAANIHLVIGQHEEREHGRKREDNTDGQPHDTAAELFGAPSSQRP